MSDMTNQDQLRLQEQQRRKLNVATCLAVVERPADKGGKFTHLSVRLPEVLMPLLGENMFNPELMKKNRDNSQIIQIR